MIKAFVICGLRVAMCCELLMLCNEELVTLCSTREEMRFEMQRERAVSMYITMEWDTSIDFCVELDG